MKSFLKHATVYGIGSLLLQMGQFLLLPLYLRCLSPGEYGLLEILTRSAETVGTILLFGGFRQALMTYYQQAESEIGRRRVVSSALTLYLVMAVLGGGCVLWCSSGLCGYLTTTFGERGEGLSPALVQTALIVILLEPFCFVPHTLLQARTESKIYLVVQLCHFLLRVSLCIAFVRYCYLGVSGVLYATLLSGLVMGLVLTGRELSRGVAWPDWAILKGLFLFALPLMPGGLCFFLLHQGDRLFLLGYINSSELGKYSLGYNLATTVSRLAFVPLFMVWSAQMYEVAKLDRSPQIFGQTFTRLLGIYALAGLSLCLIGPEVVVILGGDAYRGAELFIAPVFLACLFQGMSTLFDAGFYIHRRTGVKLLLTMGSTAVMVVLYMILIPLYGALGAALATILGFSLLATLTCIVTHRYLRVDMPWSRLAGMLLLGVCVYCCSLLVGQGDTWRLLVRLALGPITVVFAWTFGLIAADEKSALLQLLHSLGQQVLPRSFQAVPVDGEPVGTASSPAPTV